MCSGSRAYLPYFFTNLVIVDVMGHPGSGAVATSNAISTPNGSSLSPFLGVSGDSGTPPIAEPDGNSIPRLSPVTAAPPCTCSSSTSSNFWGSCTFFSDIFISSFSGIYFFTRTSLQNVGNMHVSIVHFSWRICTYHDSADLLVFLSRLYHIHNEKFKSRLSFHFNISLDKTLFNISGSTGFAICAFMPASRDFCTSSAKAFAVMAIMGMPAASMRSSARIAIAAS